MKADIEKTRQFGKLIDCYFVSESLPELEDGIVYVRDDGEDWQNAFEAARNKISGSKAMGAMNMIYELQLVGEGDWPKEAPFVNCNLLLPVSTPDRDGQCYLMVKEADADTLENAASFMIMEAHTISEACAKTALENLGDWYPEENSVDSDGDYVFPVTVGAISFGGLINAIPDAMSFLGKGKGEIARKKLSYLQRIKLLKLLPEISKRLRSEGDIEAKQVFAGLWSSLTERERGHLCYELLKRIRPKELKEIVRSTVSREDIGAGSKLTVLMKPVTMDEEISKFGLNCKLCTYLKDDSEKLYPLKFSPSTQVLYTMSLVNRKLHPDETPNMDILRNKEAFCSIYHAIYDEKDTVVKKEFDKLFTHETSNRSIHSGNLRSRFHEIENHLVETFWELDENPSPYITKEEMPLAINGQNIVLPEQIEKTAIVSKC